MIIYQFDAVWMGKHCARCKRKDYCDDPIACFFENTNTSPILCFNLAQSFFFFAS